MKIQPVLCNHYCNNVNANKKVNSAKNSTPFKGNYEQVMQNVLRRDLKSRVDVEGAISDLFFALVKEKGITKTNIYPQLVEWLGLKGTYLIEELCKPIAKVHPEFRDIIFNSQNENLPIIKKGDEKLLYIMNFGKHGFWNNIFESESAANDMRIVFMADEGCYTVGTNKKGKLTTEQFFHSGYWEKNTYNMFFGDRISHDTGNASDVIIWPSV